MCNNEFNVITMMEKPDANHAVQFDKINLKHAGLKI